MNECRKGSVATIKKLISVQHTGALAVTGGFRTSHTDTLDAHSALLPINLKIEKVCHDTITRIATLPQEHPLHKLIRKSMKRHTKHHRSPMHILTSIFGLDPSKMERIPPVCTHPKKRGLQRVCIDIPPNKDKSKRADTNALEVIRVYLDGSAHDRGVGVAAILKHEGKPDCTLKLHLDTTEQHTVYEAKLAGMIMGLYLIKTEARSKTTCVLNVDNQAALIAIKSEMNKLEQHLVVNTLQIAKQLLDHKGNKNFRLTFRWSACHGSDRDPCPQGRPGVAGPSDTSAENIGRKEYRESRRKHMDRSDGSGREYWRIGRTHQITCRLEISVLITGLDMIG